MPDRVKEKLVELVDDYTEPLSVRDIHKSDFAENFADHLIAHGVTVQEFTGFYGKWIVKGQEVFCSNCNKESGYNAWGASAFSDYCPNCGKKMMPQPPKGE